MVLCLPGNGCCVAFLIGLSTFAHRLRQRDVIIYSDNVGAKGALRKG